MYIHVRNSALAMSLVLGCLIADAPAQYRRPTEPPKDLWSVLRLPTFSQPTHSKPKRRSSPVTGALNQKLPAETADSAVKKENSTASTIDESSFSSPFSATSSNRRSALVKRGIEAAHDEPMQSAQLPAPPAPPVTPHWTPKFVEQAACLMPDDELARPVAVNMAGDLLTDRVTPTKAIVKLDATLSVVPPVKSAPTVGEEATPTRSVSEGPTLGRSTTEPSSQARSASAGSGGDNSKKTKGAEPPAAKKPAEKSSGSRLATAARPSATR